MFMVALLNYVEKRRCTIAGITVLNFILSLFERKGLALSPRPPLLPSTLDQGT